MTSASRDDDRRGTNTELLDLERGMDSTEVTVRIFVLAMFLIAEINFIESIPLHSDVLLQVCSRAGVASLTRSNIRT